MTLAEKQRRLIEDYAAIPDRHERLAAIVDRARRATPLAAAEKTELTRVPGCVSPVWLVSHRAGDCLHLRADAESPLVRGLVVLLVDFYHGATLAEIAAAEPVFLDELGITRDLSPTRRHGLAAVRARIRNLATAA